MSLANQILQQSASEPQPVLVTMSRNVDTTTTYRPVKRLKHGEFTADRMKHDTSVRDVEGAGSMEQLDVRTTADRLRKAEAALQQQDWADADQFLRQVQEAVIHTQIAGSMPLLQAQQNLELARARILEDKAGDAAVPLREAAKALADFENLSPGPDADQAEYLRQQILQHADHIRHDHADAVDWINSWLGTVNEWERKTTLHH